MKHGDESICSFILPLVFHSTWRRHVDPDRLHMRGHSRRKKRAKKRGGDDLIRNLNDYKRTCFGAGETTKSVILGGLDGSSNQNVWSRMGEELALKLSKSVVSLALSDGNLLALSDRKSHATRFLTSGSLVRALNNQAKHRDKVKIIVRHEGEVAVGLLEECDLDHDFSIVKIMSLLDVYVVSLNPALHHMPYCEVVSLGCDVAGKTMTTCGKLTCDSVTSKDHAYLMLSSCKISEVWEGGPLFDFDVDFAGMNVVPSMERSFFLPQNLINERLQHFQTFQEQIVLLEWAKHLKIARVRESLARNPLCSNLEVNGDAPNKEQYDDLEALDYSRPSKSGMILINSFEEPFGDLYCKCVWRQLDKGVYNIIKRTVVSLASFEGDTMFFACSGFVIEWDDECAHNGYQTILTSACLVRNPEYPFNDRNKIVDSLRIKVVLPNKKHRQGTLMHYNLHYNVALVSFKESSSASPIILKHEMVNHSSKLVAVGRCFRSGDLMVSSGKMANLSSPFDYKKLPYKTTCEITKAGMGGPLVDICGHYIGMNFYHPEVGTPFLFCDDIIDILDCFKNGVRESLTNGVPCSHVEPDVSNKDRHEDLGAFARAINFIYRFEKTHEFG